MLLPFAFLLTLLAGVLCWQEYLDESGHPIADDYVGNVEIAGYPDGIRGQHCPTCHENKVNRHGKLKCVLVKNCCPLRESPTTCIIDPCLFFHQSCPRAETCVASNCPTSGCIAVYYDNDLNLLSPLDCRATIHARRSRRPTVVAAIGSSSKLHKIPKKTAEITFHSSNHVPSVDVPFDVRINLPSSFLRHSAASIADINNGVAINVPRVVELYGAEKPGKCPSIQYNHIIRVCVAECTIDTECSGRHKCCFNGCAYRCQASLEHRQNFLNYPIYVQGVKDTHGKHNERRHN